MSSRRRSPHAKPGWINAVLGSMRADKAHGAASVVYLHRITIRPNAIVEHKSGHSLSIQPCRDLEALVTHRDILVASARNDKNGGTGRALLRQECVHARLIGLGIAERAGSAVRIQKNGSRNSSSSLSVNKLSKRKDKQAAESNEQAEAPHWQDIGGASGCSRATAQPRRARLRSRAPAKAQDAPDTRARGSEPGSQLRMQTARFLRTRPRAAAAAATTRAEQTQQGTLPPHRAAQDAAEHPPACDTRAPQCGWCR